MLMRTCKEGKQLRLGKPQFLQIKMASLQVWESFQTFLNNIIFVYGFEWLEQMQPLFLCVQMNNQTCSHGSVFFHHPCVWRRLWARKTLNRRLTSATIQPPSIQIIRAAVSRLSCCPLRQGHIFAQVISSYVFVIKALYSAAWHINNNRTINRIVTAIKETNQ